MRLSHLVFPRPSFTTGCATGLGTNGLWIESRQHTVAAVDRNDEARYVLTGVGDHPQDGVADRRPGKHPTALENRPVHRARVTIITSSARFAGEQVVGSLPIVHRRVDHSGT